MRMAVQDGDVSPRPPLAVPNCRQRATPPRLPDFLVFVTVDSESDEIPVGSERRLWSQDALAGEAAESGRAEEYAGKVGTEACRNLLCRFRAA